MAKAALLKMARKWIYHQVSINIYENSWVSPDKNELL